MNTWSVFLRSRALKQLRDLPRKIQDLADLAVEDLEAQGPAPTEWSVRQIEVFYFGHRRDAYR